MKARIAFVLLFALNAIAGDVAGKWSGVFRARGADHDVPQFFILKQDGNKLTGSAGPDQSEQYPLENGKVDGDQVRFEVTTGEWKFAYDLKAIDGKMAGDLELKSLNDRRTAKVSLTRTN